MSNTFAPTKASELFLRLSAELGIEAKSLDEQTAEALAFVRSSFGDADKRQFYSSIGDLLGAKNDAETCAACSLGGENCSIRFKPRVVRLENLHGRDVFVVRMKNCDSAFIRGRMRNKGFEDLFAKSGLTQKQREMTFETFAFHGHDEELPFAKTMALNAAKNRSWLCISGKCGSGKTHLAIAILLEQLKNGKSGLFRLCSEMVGELRAGHNDDTFDEKLQRFKTTDCLVIDDIGKEKVTEAFVEYVFQIVDFRYRHEQQTILTSNLTTLQEFADTKNAGVFMPIISRLHETGDLIVLKNTCDYRIRNKKVAVKRAA